MGYLFAGDVANFEDGVQSSPVCLPFPAWCTENSAEMKHVSGVKYLINPMGHTSYTGDQQPNKVASFY